jgi:tetratricopeptide (TPR) repeat protein
MPRLAFWGEAVGYTGSLVRVALLSLLAMQIRAGTAIAQECPVVGQLYSIDGQVEVRRHGAWQPAALNQSLCAQDAVRTSSLSRAAVMLVNEAVLRVDQDSTVVLTDVTTDEQKRTLLDLTRGAFQSFSRQPHSLEVNTPYLNAAVQGTEFVIRTGAGRTDVTTFEGVVTATNGIGSAAVASGQSVSASAGGAPRPYVMVRPRDAVQWGLYYPPILAISGTDLSGLRPEFAASLKRAAQHDVAGAFAALAAVPSGERDIAFHIYEAALLLSVGRVDEARKIIDQAIARNVHAGLAYALRAVIEVVQNEKAAALADAQRGVELEPDAAAPRIALSYAQQANFDLKGARDTLLEATARQPENALAWARLGELWLMFGYRKRAREAAEKGVQLAPDLERVHLVFGFTALVEFRTKIAREEFSRAIELDSADPLARFGLGLAIIRDGALADGRRYLEMAVGLDSSNSLLRSYLGKAYFEEKRDPLDAKQFDIAKQLDPLDPTPYLYDAIRLQSVNQPVDAMLSMEKSIELNDNRAIYRSRELLDSDRATRGANLAQIYDDLGFGQLAVDQGYESLTLDPSNTSAHRFLSDTFFATPRREIARVSELLQAQMLQDININPVQPSLAETNLSLATRGGPFKPGFNEYTPLFERNDIQFQGSGLVGNENTHGFEGIASALYNGFSISAGAFDYDTDGWRPNNGIQHRIYDLFMQDAVTPDFNVQVELRHHAADLGDLVFDFNPAFFNPEFKDLLDQDTVRLGARYSPSPNSDLLLSFIHGDRNEQQNNLVPGFAGFNIVTERKTDQVESQYIYKIDWFNLIAGFEYVNQNGTFELPFSNPTTPVTTLLHGYTYTNIKFPKPVTWTLGVAFDDFEQEPIVLGEQPIVINRTSPKLGVRWDITNDLSLRGAAFRWIKPILAANQNLEPTQVSGFNQVYDDSDGEVSWDQGVGLDWRLSKQLFVGADATWRDLEVPLNDVQGAAIFENWKEQLHRAYVYWAPISRLSLSGEVAYDKFDAQTGLLTSSGTPKSVDTFSIPLGARYFAPNGFFAGVTTTYVNQNVVRTCSVTLTCGQPDGRDNFFDIDATVGWRFPKRFGIATLTVYNLLNEKFFYQDDSFRDFRDEPPSGPLYVPQRRVVGRATLYF